MKRTLERSELQSMGSADHHRSFLCANSSLFELLTECRQSDSGVRIGLKSVTVARSPCSGDFIFVDRFHDSIYAP